MIINIRTFFCCGFEIITSNKDFCSTSSSISRLLNIPLDIYNKLLIEKVIQHNLCETHMFDDVTFDLYGTPKEIYLSRFKEVFAEQLTLLALEGNWSCLT